MAEQTTGELKALAREVFDREISDTQAERYRVLLPNMARAKALLRDWEEDLRATEPMTIRRMSGTGYERSFRGVGQNVRFASDTGHRNQDVGFPLNPSA
jgi:hypothetical protein